jgi:hypothetical protein
MQRHAQGFAPRSLAIGIGTMLALSLSACGSEEARPDAAATDPAMAAGG